MTATGVQFISKNGGCSNSCRTPARFESLLETQQKDRSGPLGQFFANSAHVSPLETFSSKGKSFLSSLLHHVSPNLLVKTVYDRLKGLLLDHLTKDDGATIHNFMAKVGFNIDATNLGDRHKPKYDGNYFTLFASLSHPFSRGIIYTKSASPTDKPTFDPKYLSHPMNLELLARYIQFFLFSQRLSYRNSSNRMTTDAG